ncbi:alpha/beta hydrolase [uncultured Eudoraea sp.]|uniref:alpha/beta hydrolase n=1 Tax=uncultured Eudoraea sp. TaxID=1035614 RepID=UPI00261455C7|nr:alpha/beta hydrolase [uncultured Eudoraea sp.]
MAKRIKSRLGVRITFLIILAFLLGNDLFAQDTILPLWPSNAVPNRIESDEEEIVEEGAIQRISYVQFPQIEVYLPSEANSNGKAMLIFPGGGYQILAYDWEGSDIAKFLNSKGIAGIVVKYRLPVSGSLENNQYVPLQDAQRAIRLVRYMAKTWNIHNEKIGVIGFSAGGHLASTLGTHFDDEVYKYVDGADLLSARPDFMALVYPVISFTALSAHSGSKNALLGDKPKDESMLYFSNELQVSENTPPTILFHASDDSVVPPENSLLFYKALNQKKVSAELHIYPKGGHGFSLATKNPGLSRWTQHLYEWTLQF